MLAKQSNDKALLRLSQIMFERGNHKRALEYLAGHSPATLEEAIMDL